MHGDGSPVAKMGNDAVEPSPCFPIFPVTVYYLTQIGYTLYRAS